MGGHIETCPYCAQECWVTTYVDARIRVKCSSWEPCGYQGPQGMAEWDEGREVEVGNARYREEWQAACEDIAVRQHNAVAHAARQIVGGAA